MADNQVEMLTLYDVDLPALYLLCRRHAMLKKEHLLEGTHRFEDPVSKMTCEVEVELIESCGTVCH